MDDLIDLDLLKMRVAPPARDLIVARLKDDKDSLVHYRNNGERRG